MVSDILFPDVDIILPDGTVIPKYEEVIDYTSINIIYPDDNNKQTNTDGDMLEPVRDVLGKESELD